MEVRSHKCPEYPKAYTAPTGSLIGLHDDNRQLIGYAIVGHNQLRRSDQYVEHLNVFDLRSNQMTQIHGSRRVSLYPGAAIVIDYLER